MGRKKGADQAYLVMWPKVGIVKAGYSAHRRWRDFEIRGASLVGAWSFVNHREAFDAEELLLGLLDSGGSPAFTSAKESVPYLGNGGGGWRECYRVPTPMLGRMLGHCSVAMLLRNAEIESLRYARTDGRTDGEACIGRNQASGPYQARTYVDFAGFLAASRRNRTDRRAA